MSDSPDGWWSSAHRAGRRIGQPPQHSGVAQLTLGKQQLGDADRVMVHPTLAPNSVLTRGPPQHGLLQLCPIRLTAEPKSAILAKVRPKRWVL